MGWQTELFICCSNKLEKEIWLLDAVITPGFSPKMLPEKKLLLLLLLDLYVKQGRKMTYVLPLATVNLTETVKCYPAFGWCPAVISLPCVKLLRKWKNSALKKCFDASPETCYSRLVFTKPWEDTVSSLATLKS